MHKSDLNKTILSKINIGLYINNIKNNYVNDTLTLV